MKPALLGDTHLGRRFTKGIPLARRGERERLVREDFLRQLDPAGAKVHIHMGDIFDKPQVAYEDLLFAAEAYRAASLAHPTTNFYILQGNHDDSRDLEEVTAWDVFQSMMHGYLNVFCVTEPMLCEDFVLLPWFPIKTAVQAVSEIEKAMTLTGMRPTTAYGHWDVDPRSSPHNLIPTGALAFLGITEAYTGHIHKPDQFHRNGVDVTVVGSMQPYAQGEDGGQSGAVRYTTLCLDALQDYITNMPGALDNSCVRLQLQPGEHWDGDVPNCRSFDIQRIRPTDEAAPADISMEGFDITKAFGEALDEHDILPAIRERIEHRWLEHQQG